MGGRQHDLQRLQQKRQGHHQGRHPDPALGRLPLGPRAQPRPRDQLRLVRGGRQLRQQHLGGRDLQRWPKGRHARRPLLLTAPIMPRQVTGPDRKRSPTLHPRRAAPRITGAVAASLITAAAVAGATTAGAPAAANTTASVTPCVAWTGGEQPPDPGGTLENHTLRGVAVLSPCNAWAVGNYGGGGQALITHWDGASWTAVPS